MSNESEKMQWHDVTVKVRFLARKWPGSHGYDFSKFTLQDIAWHILDGNGEFLGTWSYDKIKVVEVKEAEEIAVALGNDGGWVTDHLDE
jgi:hypothetical protein